LKAGQAMDLLERYFGFFHDHGDGSLEAIILLVMLIITFGLGLGYFYKHHPRD
jgi:hypothetical protein